MKRIVILFCALAACGRTPEEMAREKLNLLETSRRETMADLSRSQAECLALAIEAPGLSGPQRVCWEAHSAMTQLAIKTLSDIDRRETEIKAKHPGI